MIDPLETIARTIVVDLAASVTYTALLVALVAVVGRATRAGATTRHILWWFALAAAAAIPLASVAGSFARIERHPIITDWGRAEAPLRGGIRTYPSDPIDRRPVTSNRTDTADAANAFRTIARAVAPIVAYPHAGEIALAVWLVGALGGCASLAASFVALGVLKRASRPLDDGVMRRLRRFRQSMRSGRAVALRVSDEVDVPVAVGFRTPTILVPSLLASADETYATSGDLDRIVLHEYAHLERYDDWTNAFGLAIERLFWFDPFVRFAAGRIALEREIAADDWVVARTGGAHRYATCLWKLVESVRLPTRRIAAPGALYSPRQITVRIEQLLDARRAALPRFSPAALAVMGIAALVIVVAQAVRAPAISLDILSAPVGTAATHVVAAARVAAAPTPAPTPFARRTAHTTLVLHHVPVEATPDAIARAVATAVAASTHADVTTHVTRHVMGPDSYADEIGIDVARHVRDEVRPLAPARVEGVRD